MSNLETEYYTYTDNGDHDKFAHYADKNEILQSALTGEPIMALCGKIWVPTRDPEKFPKCQMCIDIYEEIKKRENSGN